MKTFLGFIFIICFSSTTMFPQNKYSAFGAPAIKITSLSGHTALVIGGKFGFVINENIVIGGGFYGLISNVHTDYIDIPSGQNVMINLNYGGLELEYIFFSRFLIHGSIELLLAGGGVYFDISDKSVPHNNYSKVNFLVYEPSLNIEYNTLSWLRIDLNLSYRIITSYELENYGVSQKDLNGLTAGLIFKFGSY